MKHKLLFVLALIFLTSALYAFDFQGATQIPKLDDIQLSGDLSSPNWKKAVRMVNFKVFGSQSKPKEATIARVFCSNENIYFGFECSQDKPLVIKPNSPAYEQDCVKVNIFTILGEIHKTLTIVSAGNLQYLDSTAKTGLSFESKTASSKGKWTCEIKVPIKLLGLVVSDNMPVRINLSRYNASTLERSTSEYTRDSFHDPASACVMLLKPSPGKFAVDASKVTAITFNTDIVLTIPVQNLTDDEVTGSLSRSGDETHNYAFELAPRQKKEVKVTLPVSGFDKNPELFLKDSSGIITGVITPKQVDFEPTAFTPRKIISAKFANNSLGLNCVDAKGLKFTIRLDALENGIIRMRAVQGKTVPDNYTLMLAKSKFNHETASFIETKSGYSFKTKLMTVEIGKNPIKISIFDKNNRLLTASKALGVSVGTGFKLSMDARDDEKYYGFGSGPGADLERNGRKWLIWVWHNDSGDLFFPYFFSTAGYGVFSNNSYRTQFDMCQTKKDSWEIISNGGIVDMFYFAGNPKEIINQYTSITGKPVLPPAWAFGYWQSTTRFDDQSTLMSNAKRMRSESIPCDVIAQDPGWANAWMDCRWHPQRFPEPEKLMDYLNEEHFKLGLWTVPFVNPDVDFKSEGDKNGYFARTADGKSTAPVGWWLGDGAGLIDFTDPKAVQWWGQKFSGLIKMGVDVIKTDGGDSEVTTNLNFKAGMADQFHNLYQLYFAKGVYEQMEKQLNGKRSCIWIRSGISGLQRFPCSWGGDQPATFTAGRILLTGGQNAGLGGVCFWSHDMGGFGSDPSEEYYIRSCQWGLISPLSRAHGCVNEPWSWGQRASAIFKKFAQTRYKLLPYIYSIAHEANQTGIPLMRAMLLEFSNDADAAKQKYQYMFGPSLMVAPVYEYSKTADLTATRSVYFPKQIWYDFWTGRKVEGQPRTTQVSIPIDTMPIYVRAGSIIPTLPEAPQYIENGSFGNKINLDIYAGANGMFTLYEDDGLSNDYKNGAFATTNITYKEIGSSSTLTINPRIGTFKGSQQSTKREWTITIHSAKKPNYVSISNYTYDEALRTLTLTLPSASGRVIVN